VTDLGTQWTKLQNPEGNWREVEREGWFGWCCWRW